MTEFKYGDFTVLCHSEGTRYGFRHLGDLYINGIFERSDKVCYYNRTWERFEFETLISKLADKCPEFKAEMERLKTEEKI